MAASIFEGAATGSGLNVLFDGFLDLVKEVVKHNILFKSNLKSLQETLMRLEPTLKRIDGYNRELDRLDEMLHLRTLIEKGKKLVRKCSKVNKANFFAKPYYNQKLMKLNGDIQKFIDIDMRMNQTLDGKETLYEVKRLGSQLQQLTMMAENAHVGGVIGVVGGFEGVCSPPGLRYEAVGLELPIKDLKGKLLKDENSSSLTVICGLGGSGKTTLAISLCHDEKVKEKFNHNILYVCVSKMAHLTVIVQRLFQHKGYPIPQFQSKEDEVNQLEQMFKQISTNCPILLVLDDVRPGSENFVEDLRFPIKNYKIVVTSRYEFPSFGSTYKLQTLNDADATKLFYQTAFLPDGDCYRPHKDVIAQIVKSCGGFPLAIIVVAKSLRGRYAADWKKKAEECSKTAILSDAELLECLQSSVDALGSKMKKCFKDLGSFPEAKRIPATALLDMWMERHKLEENSAAAYLHEIADRSLVDLVVIRKVGTEVDGSYNDHYISQHDQMRELAILQSNTGGIEKRERVFVETTQGKLPDWWMEQSQLTISAKLLSISTDNKFSSNWGSIQAPEVEVLLLHFQSKTYALPQFLENMDKLKVLIIKNYSFYPAELGNFDLLGSFSNLKRIRLENISFPSKFLSSIKFPSLQKLSLVMCNTAQAFDLNEVDVTTVLPSITEIYINYCNDLTKLPTSICHLVTLKKLIITNCQKLTSLPKEIHNLVNLEVLNLNSCFKLADIPDEIADLRMLSILDISECLRITKFPESIGGLKNLTKLCMIDCSIRKLPSTIGNLVNLKELISDEETAGLWKECKSYLPDLEVKVRKGIINLNWLG